MKSNRSPSLVLVLLLAACGGTPATPDAGSRNDAATPTDSGSGTDAATTADTGGGTDGGTPRDTGTTVDAASDVDAFVDCAPRTIDAATPGFAYVFDGVGPNPVLHLCAGVTYTFDTMDVGPTHPIGIMSGATLMTTIPPAAVTMYTVPASGPQPDAYACTIHAFGAAIVVH